MSKRRGGRSRRDVNEPGIVADLRALGAIVVIVHDADCDDGCSMLDLVVIWRGIIGIVEVKQPGGKLRPGQSRFIERARAQGALAFKAESTEEIIDEFERSIRDG
jgi:hypothetical protein